MHTPTLDDADRLEREAWAAVADFHLDHAMAAAAAAHALRAELQGASHPDLIWPLSLQIEALVRRHRMASAQEAARLGEARLALQRLVLADSRDELVSALRGQLALYQFEGECFAPTAVAAIESELADVG